MHLLCRDTECVGNDLPAGADPAGECVYCGAALADADGRVLIQTLAPLVNGEPPADFDALMDALRDAGYEVRVVDLSLVRAGERLLVSALEPDGQLAAAAVLEGREAASMERFAELMEEA